MKMSRVILGLVIVSLLVSMALPMACAGKPNKPGGGGGGNEPPADPAIAYTVTGTVSSLVVMNADGSNREKIYSGPRFGIPLSKPSWSPDGGSIAFKNGNSGSELWRIDVEVINGVPQGTHPTVLLDRIQEGPEWSPGGQYNDHILFTRYPASGGWARELEVIPAIGGTPQTVYTAVEGHSVWLPVWSPAGDKIAFLEGTDTDYTLRILDIGTEEVTVIRQTMPAGNQMCLDWARTQNTLAYGAYGTVYMIDISTGDLEFFNDGGTPSWSPDDSHLVFQSSRGSLVSYEFSTGKTTKLVSGGNWPDWSRFTST